MAALALQQVDQGLVDLAGQHHLHDIHSLAVGDAQAVDELRLLAQALHDIVDIGAAAVDQYDAHADEPEQYDVLHDLLLEVLVDHSVAAVFDDHDLAVIFLDVRQGGGQYLRPLHI